MARITYTDIARAAGVGTATVERVMNARGGVRPQTVERVVTAVQLLGYPRRLPEIHRGITRIEVVLVRPETTFFARLAGAFERIGATLDASVAIHRTFLDEADADAIAAHIREPKLRRSALIAAVPDGARVRDALMSVRRAGIPVVQVVTRVADDAVDFVGIDNYAAGRTAGLLLSRMQHRDGAVVAICHSQIYQVHRDRIRGFSHYLAANPRAGLCFQQVLFGRDDRQQNGARLTEALARWPDLVGLYNAGGGNSGLVEILKRRPPGREIFFIAHELTELSKAALREGSMSVVLDQAPEAQARRAVDLVLWRLGLLQVAVDNPAVRFITVTSENL
jgi:LacI family transcriptional regulator